MGKRTSVYLAVPTISTDDFYTSCTLVGDPKESAHCTAERTFTASLRLITQITAFSSVPRWVYTIVASVVTLFRYSSLYRLRVQSVGWRFQQDRHVVNVHTRFVAICFRASLLGSGDAFAS